ASSVRTPLMWAAYHNDVRMVRLLLECGADPDQSTYFGNPLSHACWSDSFEAAELLIARGANVSARDALANFTPLHWAAGSESPRGRWVWLWLATGAAPTGAGGARVGVLGLAPKSRGLFAKRGGGPGFVDFFLPPGAKAPPRAEKIATPQRALAYKFDN